ncbi:GNAT family N-acetyltransferase [Polaromonas sp.]|uniref:GNAT family N-acetyltransferase n=1 Tax=Polaromonas sp. TaxID=1869339 RepID=UPI003265C653
MLIKQAQLHEVSLVAEVLTAAAENLIARGEMLWPPSEVNEAAIHEHVRTGWYFMASDDEGPVGVFRFQLEDRHFWPEIPEGSSAFVHKVAVHPRAQGQELAQALLAHACGLARQHGRQHLRLDCRHGRTKLMSLYERFGFRHHSEKQIGLERFDRYEIEVSEHEAPPPATTASGA